jgi:hypothetical protein
MPNLPYLGPAGISRIIDEMERTQLGRGLVRNAVAKAERAQRSDLLRELNQMAPADLAKLSAAASRVERQQNLTDARVALTQLKLNRIENRRDLQAIRQLFSRGR